MTAVRPRSTGCPGYTVTRERTPKTAKEARRLAHVALCTWGLDDDAEIAALLLSELVTNAVRHACGRSVRIVIDRPATDRFRVAVVDRSPRQLPQLRTLTADADDGRGLFLVHELSDQWGCDLLGPGRRPWGKRVWAEVRVSG
ncbi:ATP-binding protein [Streptomyces sp. NPDC018019]|uniref:ATP-binding protein n=1 Tax=Streptomyces sp. NPDC018019 TaxID=3365030 RepID=UPI0037BA0B2D